MTVQTRRSSSSSTTGCGSRRSTGAATVSRCCCSTRTGSAPASSTRSRDACATRYRPIGVDLRGHGGTDTPANACARDYAFEQMAADVVAVLDHLGIDDVRLRSASRSAAASPARRRRRCPARSGASCCARRSRSTSIALGLQRPPSPGRRRRQLHGRRSRASAVPVWPDRATVRASYGSRPPLDALAPDALDAYVRWGFVDRPDGQVELACAAGGRGDAVRGGGGRCGRTGRVRAPRRR